jgi:hypothetical protein
MADTNADVAAQVQELQRLVKDQAAFISGLKAGASQSTNGDSSTSKKTKDEGPWAPHYPESNPHAPRPKTVSDEPQLYDLAQSPTYALLEAKVSSFKYEFRTVEPVLSYLSDSKALLEEVLPTVADALNSKRSKPLDGDTAPSAEDQTIDSASWSIAALRNSLEKTYKLLAQRADYIRLKVKFDNQPGGITLAERALLQHLEIKFYGMADGLSLVDSDINEWMSDFGEKSATATLNWSAKLHAQSSGNRGGKGKGKGQKGQGRGKGGGKGGPATHAID